MSTFKRIILLAALLLGALLCYQAGFARGTVLLVILGMLLEAGFWFGIFRWEKSQLVSHQGR